MTSDSGGRGKREASWRTRGQDPPTGYETWTVTQVVKLRRAPGLVSALLSTS